MVALRVSTAIESFWSDTVYRCVPSGPTVTSMMPSIAGAATHAPAVAGSSATSRPRSLMQPCWPGTRVSAPVVASRAKTTIALTWRITAYTNLPSGLMSMPIECTGSRGCRNPPSVRPALVIAPVARSRLKVTTPVPSAA